MGLSLHSVARTYGDHLIFEHVTLELPVGERLGLTGENGSGKSTLLRVMAGLEAPDAGSVAVTGAVALLTQLSGTPRGTLTEAVTPPALLAAQRAFNDAARALDDGTEAAAQHFASAEEHLRLAGGYDFTARAATVLAGLNLDPDGHARHLSGGQMRRLMLARLLLSPAKIYLLDEPTNHLDARSVRWLEGWIAAQPSSFVLASHDRAFLDAVSTRTAELERGHLSVYPGGYSEAMHIKAGLRAAQERQYEAGRRQRSALEEERRRQASKGAVKENRRRAPDNDKFLSSHKAGRAQQIHASRARAMQKQLDRLDDQAVDKPFQDRRSLHLELPPTPPGPSEVLSARNLGVERGNQQVISGLNLELRRGERLALTGPNGSGKSTLLAAIRGALPHSGELRLGAGLLLAWTGQNHEELDSLETVQDALLDANPLLTPHQLYELSASVGLSEGPSQRVGTLSGGQLTRLSFARLGVVRAQLLLLDEPTNHLDVRAIEALEALLRRFEGTVILASHDRRLTERVATRTLELPLHRT